MTPAEFSSLFDEAHAITCKAVRQVPEARRDFRPVPEMMSAFDLIFHMFSQERAALVGAVTGELRFTEFAAVEADKTGLRTIEDLARYGEQVHQETRNWLSAVSETGIRKPVKTFIGPSTPEKLLHSALVHMFHHRGQLYVYLRLMGIEPVFVWTGEPMELIRARMRELKTG
jgi:uncharacterized damage-inducible protein DinB